MTGTSLLVLLPAWIALCAWIAHCLGDLFTDNPLRLELKAVLFIALLPLVLIDELIGKAQFDQLCATRAVLTVHAPTRGRAVYLAELPMESVPGTMIPVHVHKRVYLDLRLHDTVVSFSVLQAEGGKLARLLGRSSAGPITFTGRCGLQQWHERLSELGLSIVRRPEPETPGS